MKLMRLARVPCLSHLVPPAGPGMHRDFALAQVVQALGPLFSLGRSTSMNDDDGEREERDRGDGDDDSLFLAMPSPFFNAQMMLRPEFVRCACKT